MAVLCLDHVSYAYSKGTPFEKGAVDDVTYTFDENSITGLIGHTGSGKSTIVQLMNGLLRPDSGAVFLDGVDIWEKPKQLADVRFRVGVVFQYPEYQLFEETVYKDIAFGPKNMGLPDEEIHRRVSRAAEFTKTSPTWLEASPFELSGGQKRRVAIAGVIAMEPDVLILDEPAAGLDPRSRADILDGIRTYQRKSGKTVIMVSHSMEDMALYADKLVVMNHGKIAFSGTPDVVFRDREAIRKMGLSVPQITELCAQLRANGMPLSDKIYTVEQAEREIMRCLSGKEGAVC